MSGGWQALAVAGGAAVGALIRWRTGLWLAPVSSTLPLGTLVVNCIGGLLVGAVLALLARYPNDGLRLLLVTGFLGGLTTFSAFSAESLSLVERGQIGWAMLHTAAHVGGALLCAAAGARVARWLLA